MKREYLPAFILIALLLCTCKTVAVKRIQYSDQSNNHYTITRTSLVYSPVTPEESSSGIYSGGDPVEVQLTRDEFEKVLSLADKIMKASEGKEMKREMLTSVLVISEENETQKAILKRSDARSTLEELLQKLKQ
ncbi:MAG: hypothetical protein DWP94_14715 [Flavobacterium sp.]|nr:MAG: hypothetical protein DWP94_14715 [Flavobacterium sp.]